MHCMHVIHTYAPCAHTHTSLHICQGYKQQKGFIIAQAPMKSTCQDFWKMVYERECGVIVMLSDLVESGEVGLNWALYRLLILHAVQSWSHFPFTGGVLPVLAFWWYQGGTEVWGVHRICSPNHKAEWLHTMWNQHQKPQGNGMSQQDKFCGLYIFSGPMCINQCLVATLYRNHGFSKTNHFYYSTAFNFCWVRILCYWSLWRPIVISC